MSLFKTEGTILDKQFRAEYPYWPWIFLAFMTAIAATIILKDMGHWFWAIIVVVGFIYWAKTSAKCKPFLYEEQERKRNEKAAQPVAETVNEKSTQKKPEDDKFNAQNVRIIQERERQAQQDAERNPVRVHTIETDDGYLSIEWQQQFDEIKQAWNAGDYDFARTWLQKLAYAITNENTPPEVHDKFKKLMVAFTRDDPLYAEVMRVALPVISANPGIVQSTLSKQFSQFDAEQFRYAMYYGGEAGDVIREKKGRSYALSIPV